MIVGKEHVEVCDEIFPFKFHLIVEVNLREELEVGVQVKGCVQDGALEEQLD
jgi:hypothetical protein